MNNTEANVVAEFLAPTPNFTSDCTPEQLKVKVGTPVTICMHSDSHPGTIVKVFKKSVLVRRDRAIRTDSNGMSESQSYRFIAGSNDPKDWERFNLNGQGRYQQRGSTLAIGVRKSYFDYSF